MIKVPDIIGMKFNKLTVIEKIFNTKRNRYAYKCSCDCGGETITDYSSLKNSRSTSCGCNRKKALDKCRYKHGKSETRLYSIYCNMKQRCYNTNKPKYMSYGGRGIVICKDWLDDFMNFYNWANDNGYSDNLSIDRIDNNGIYEPSNCRWETSTVQVMNRRRLSTSKSEHENVMKIGNKYKVTVRKDKQKNYLGSFNTIEEAIKARDKFKNLK